MTIAELLGQTHLNLTALGQASKRHVGRTLHDVRFLELPGESSRFKPGGLALTTGLWMGRHPERQLEFVQALATHRVVALGLRVGVVVPRMADSLVTACEDHGIIALQIPPTTTLEAVARTVTAGQDLPLEVVQRELTRTLEAGSEQGMIERLEQLIRTPVALVAPWGHTLASAGDLDVTALWSVMHHPGDADRISESSGGIVQSLVVRLEGLTRAVLIAAAADLGHAARIRPALEFARMLLEVGMPGRREATDQERLVRGGLLRELLLEPWHAERSPARLEAFGFAQGEPIALALIEIRDAWAQTRSTRTSQLEFRRLLDDLRQAGEARFQTLGLPCLTGTLSSTALLAWQTRTSETHLQSLHAALLGAAPNADIRLGISRSHPAHDLRAAQREAQFAVQAVASARGALHFAHMDALAWVAATGPSEGLRALHDATLGLIRAHDIGGTLEHTLRTYFAHDRNQTETARLLGVHLNTLRYRLRRIEELINVTLDHTATVARLQLVLMASGRLDQNRG
jgi:hypothetical protein